MAEGNKTFSDSLGVVGGFGFIKYNTDPFGKSFNGLINAQTSDLSERSSIGVEAIITVYGLIGDKGLVGFAGAFLHLALVDFQMVTHSLCTKIKRRIIFHGNERKI